MGRKEQRKKEREDKLRELQQKGFLSSICENIKSGKVLPIISNNVHFDHIFDIDGDGIIGLSADKNHPANWSIEEQLTESWAEQVHFPLDERHQLPRVALYNRVVNPQKDFLDKRNYLLWLKGKLLDLAEDDESQSDELLDELNDNYGGIL